jgi:carotenoid cleavage dioxygenase-like enzyme
MSALPVHENPALDGANAPVAQEIVATGLRVIGEIPRDLNGVYVRNGPNPYFTPDWRYHAYDGDGMLHSVSFERGNVVYRNKWIRTAGLEEEIAAGRPLWKGLKEPPRGDRPDEPIKNASNTDVKFHGGRLLTTYYRSGLAYHVDLHTLETLGAADFSSEVPRISAHSRPDETTGELLWFDYGNDEPYYDYGVLGPDRKLRHKIRIDLPGPRLPHDMSVTPNYSILHDFPLFRDDDAVRARRFKLSFHAELPSRFAVLPRYGSASQLRWFEAAPTFLLHVVNTWEEGNEIVMLGTPYKTYRGRDGKLDVGRMLDTVHYRRRDYVLWEWRFDLDSGRVRERAVDDVLNTEFPVINPAYQGIRNRWSYHVVFPYGGEEEPRFPGIVKYDLDSGGYAAWSDGPHTFYNEPGFAPRDGARSEDDGYLVAFVWNARDSRSEVQIFDCQRFGLGPIARVVLPQRVPHGFHATFVSAARLASGL